MNRSLVVDMAGDGFGERVVLGSRSGGLTAEAARRMSVAGARAIRQAGASAVIYLG